MDTASWLQDMAAFILVASLKGTLLVAAVLLVQKLCAGWLSAGGRYLLWLPVLLGLLTPLGFDAELPVPPAAVATLQGDLAAMEVRTGNWSGAADSSQAEMDAALPLPIASAAPAAAAPAAGELAPVNKLASMATLLYVLPWVWLSGVAAVLALLVASQYRLATLIRRALPAPQALEQQLADCRRLAACKTKVRVLLSSDVAVPMVAGLLRPVLLLPADIEQQLTPAQLRHVFIHELIHLQRGDILVNWVVALAQALHWFNPVIWFAFHCLRQDRELACDSATLQLLGPAERAGYGHTLLQLNDARYTRPVPAVALGILESGSQLQRRIHMLVQQPSHPRLQSLSAGLLLLPLAAVAFSQPTTVRSSATAAPVEAAQSLVQLPAAESVTTAAVPAALPAAAPTITAAPGNAEPPAAAAVTAESTAAAAALPAEVAVAAPVMQLAQIDAASQSPSAPAPAPAAPAAAAPEVDADADADVDAASPLLPAAAPEPVAAPDDELAAIRQLGSDIALMQAEMIGFVEKWDAMGNTCEARKDSFFGVLSASCQRIRTALRNGDILGFDYQCFLLNSIHAQQVERYRETRAQQPELPDVVATLDANEAALATFCSRDTFDTRYPAFAGILAEAETKPYSPPQQFVASSRLNPPWNGGQRWVDMVNSTSMISHTPGAMASPFPTESYSSGFSPSNPAGGAAMDGGMGGSSGGSSGGDGGGAAPAP